MDAAKKGITQAPAKKSKKPVISKKHAALIAAAMKKHEAQKPVVHVSVHTPGTDVSSNDKETSKADSVDDINWDEED